MSVVRFDQSVSTAQYLGTLKQGFVKAWGFSPFWIGKSKQGVEGSQPNPTAANLEVRDGIYVVNDPAISGRRDPVVMPWTGEVWVYNNPGPAFQPGESASNVVIVDLENGC